jgi:hypothetical protein
MVLPAGICIILLTNFGLFGVSVYAPWLLALGGGSVVTIVLCCFKIGRKTKEQLDEIKELTKDERLKEDEKKMN